MKQHIEEKVKRNKLVSVTCDRCGVVYNNDDMEGADGNSRILIYKVYWWLSKYI